MKHLVQYFFVPLLFTFCQSQEAQNIVNENYVHYDGLELANLTLPTGFKIDVFARVDNARSLVMTEKGTLFISNRLGGSVYAVKDIDGDFKIDNKYVIARDLNLPNGIAFKDGALYVAEVSKLWKYENIEENLNNIPKPILIYDNFPTDKHHGWKYINFGPDGKLYVPVGAPCNICESKNKMYASITRMNADGSNREIFAQGVRNTVGFTWHPVTKEMWFTDNGRDMLGDDTPPCELNKVSFQGEHFGYPYWHGSDVKDPEFGNRLDKNEFTPPVQNLKPHVAPLGLKFYTGNMFPEKYFHNIFIAEHGSWNRSEKAGHTGHEITLVTIKGGKSIGCETFIEGFLDEKTNSAWGRPVDLIFLKDGSMLISDDHSGTVYRVWYED